LTLELLLVVWENVDIEVNLASITRGECYGERQALDLFGENED
jgi:hypothetical protein